jgi:hypothetical protein
MPTSQQSPTPTGVEELEEVATETGLAIAYALRAAEVSVAVLIGLLVCPPLAILTFLVVVPLAAVVIAVSLVAAALAAPYLLVRHLRGHEVPHASVFAHRARHAVHALVALLPHRIVRESRP